MLEQVRVLENPLFIGIQMALYTSQDFLLEQELRRDMMHFYCFIYLLYIRNFLILTCTVYILAPHFANCVHSVTAVAV